MLRGIQDEQTEKLSSKRRPRQAHRWKENRPENGVSALTPKESVPAEKDRVGFWRKVAFRVGLG